MSETRLASQLRKKYQQQPSDENRPTTARTSEAEPDQQLQAVTERVLKVDRKDQVARELESIKDSYAWLVMSAGEISQTFKQLFNSAHSIAHVQLREPHELSWWWVGSPECSL